MDKFKRICKKIIFPPLWIKILISVISVIGMAAAIITGFADNPILYVMYGVSFYALCVYSVFFAKQGSRIFKSAKSKIIGTKYGSRYISDIDFKTHITLYFALIMNVANIALNILYGFIFKTNWFFILVFYYSTLTLMRFLLAQFTRKHTIGENMLGEWQRARLCAAVLTLINLSLSGVVLMMMYQDKGFTYAGMLIYVMAAYSFYHITVAIIDLIKYRKYNSPIINSVKMIKLAAALVSMLSLETAMLSTFGGDMPLGEKRVMIAATGAGICLIVIGLSSFMIVESTNKINEIKENNNDRK